MKTSPETIRELRKYILKGYNDLGKLLNQVDIVLGQIYKEEKEVTKK